jgi:hypothetical protein
MTGNLLDTAIESPPSKTEIDHDSDTYIVKVIPRQAMLIEEKKLEILMNL